MLHGHKRSSLAVALLATTMLTQPGMPQAAPGDALGGEFQVNSFTTGNQLLPTVALDADGDFVVAWTDYSGQDGSLYGVFAQRFSAAGVAQGPEFQVNSFTTGFQGDPAVAMDADGDFIVAWTDYGGQDGSSYGVFAQRYDAAGVTQGPELQVNSFTTGNQDGPTVAMDADGDFVVAWTSFGQDGSSWGIFAQRYDAEGVAQGPEFQVNGFTTGDQSELAVAMDADGDFVVAWTDFSGQDGSSYGVFAQRFDAGGVPQGPEVQVNSFTTGEQLLPAVAMDADGDYVVAWESWNQDGSSYGVFAQRFDGAERVAGDFDGDGNADVLWHNTSTGTAVVWLMEGATKLAAQSIGAPPVAWQVAGIGEFNGDNKADILWRNTTTGTALVWQMDGFTKVAAAGVGGAPPVWVVEKVQDSDGDGLSDIFWRNGSTGATLVWRMRGFTKVATGGTGGVNAVWEVQ
ncbi:MAG: FG-GAP-like repeat-containing protein [Rhodospirillales bacterium]|nr:FG-GAP-like repeat-containing protein [Rhodospirillales bacterium]